MRMGSRTLWTIQSTEWRQTRPWMVRVPAQTTTKMSPCARPSSWRHPPVNQTSPARRNTARPISHPKDPSSPGSSKVISCLAPWQAHSKRWSSGRSSRSKKVLNWARRCRIRARLALRHPPVKRQAPYPRTPSQTRPLTWRPTLGQALTRLASSRTRWSRSDWGRSIWRTIPTLPNRWSKARS